MKKQYLKGFYNPVRECRIINENKKEKPSKMEKQEN